MNPRTLLAAALVLALAVTVYLRSGEDSGAVAAPGEIGQTTHAPDAALARPEAMPAQREAQTVAPASAPAPPAVVERAATETKALIAGRAIDPLDAPLVDIEIWLVAAVDGKQPVFGAWVGPFESRSTRTDEDGRFEYAEVAPGTWWVGPAMVDGSAGAKSAGVMLPLATTVAIAPGQDRAEVLLRCQTGLWTRGLVVDPDENPVEGAYVLAWNSAAGMSVDARSSADGAFAAGPLPAGACTLVASGGGTFAPSPEVDAIAGATGVELRLVRAGALRGTIVDAASGAALAGGVSIFPRREGAGGMSWYAPTAERAGAPASFAFDVLPPGDYDVVAIADGERVGVLGAVTVESGVVREGVSVEVARGGTVRVRTDSRFGGHPIRVTARGASLASSVAGSESVFEQLVPAGRAEVTIVDRDGQIVAVRTIDVVAGEAQDVAFE